MNMRITLVAAYTHTLMHPCMGTGAGIRTGMRAHVRPPCLLAQAIVQTQVACPEIRQIAMTHHTAVQVKVACQPSAVASWLPQHTGH